MPGAEETVAVTYEAVAINMPDMATLSAQFKVSVEGCSITGHIERDFAIDISSGVSLSKAEELMQDFLENPPEEIPESIYVYNDENAGPNVI